MGSYITNIEHEYLIWSRKEKILSILYPRYESDVSYDNFLNKIISQIQSWKPIASTTLGEIQA